ncbi:peptide chain release factor N(5)-glutamine methyltransferase, partial [Plantactinospora sp. GCM10030261]|uniref:peptide chain release factor N(5)-glutamine methyltransferase n=1 Tax=Plantactinospora sp. GCM10030261 TaxID=3273420 RepID=UPI003620AD7B
MTDSRPQPPVGTERTRPSVAVGRAAARLAAAGLPSARAEAELLTAYVLGVARGRLALADGLDAGELTRLDGLVSRRVGHEPLQHLLGTAPFRHIELAVGPGVFVPRPETELLAGWGIEAVRAGSGAAAPGGEASVTVVDLCGGSGAIALSVANEVPEAAVVAVERSGPALDWLRRNAAARAAAGDPPIRVVAGDVTDRGLLPELTGRVDLVLCNPPYVPVATSVPAEVARHDPAEAVFGGSDGLAVIRSVIVLAARLLRPGGRFGVEHDDTHGAAVPDLLRADGRFAEVDEHPDLAGRRRFRAGRRHPSPP